MLSIRAVLSGLLVGGGGGGVLLECHGLLQHGSGADINHLSDGLAGGEPTMAKYSPAQNATHPFLARRQRRSDAKKQGTSPSVAELHSASFLESTAQADNFQKSALIVVDIQRDFVDETCFAQFPESKDVNKEAPQDKMDENREAWLNFVRNVVSAFKKKGALVVHTVDAHSKNHISHWNSETDAECVVGGLPMLNKERGKSFQANAAVCDVKLDPVNWEKRGNEMELPEVKDGKAGPVAVPNQHIKCAGEVREGEGFSQMAWCAHGATPRGALPLAVPGLEATELTSEVEDKFDCTLVSESAPKDGGARYQAGDEFAHDFPAKPGKMYGHNEVCAGKTVEEFETNLTPEQAQKIQDVFVEKGMHRMYESFSGAFAEPYNANQFWETFNNEQRKEYMEETHPKDRKDLTGLTTFMKAMNDKRGIEKIYVIGLVRNICVRKTAADFKYLGYPTEVIMDLTLPINAPEQPDTDCTKTAESLKTNLDVDTAFMTTEMATSPEQALCKRLNQDSLCKLPPSLWSRDGGKGNRVCTEKTRNGGGSGTITKPIPVADASGTVNGRPILPETGKQVTVAVGVQVVVPR